MAQCVRNLLFVGATGFMGRFVAEASLAIGHTTYVLVRPSGTCPSKIKAIEDLQDKGAIIVHGSISDRDFMEKIMKDLAIDVVISAVAGENSILDQIALVDAIKAVGTVKRFLPSEFGHDVDRADPVEPGLTMYNEKRKVRRAIEATGILYTYICCNSIAAWPYHDNTHPSKVPPPLDRFQIYGDGNVKAYFVEGADIGKFTMKMIDDDRTVNKTVHFRPTCNFLNVNELAFLWEKKIGRTLPRVTITEEQLLAAAAENSIPRSIVASLTHDIFIKGCQVNFTIEGPKDVEVSHLYPDTPFSTMEQCFDNCVMGLQEQQPMDDEIEITNSKEEEITTPNSTVNSTKGASEEISKANPMVEILACGA